MKIIKSDFVFVLFITLVLFFGWQSAKVETTQNKAEKIKRFRTVGRVDKEYRRYFSYTYFYQNKMYYGSKETAGLVGRQYIGKFYKVEIDMNHPKESSIDLEQEVTD